MTEQPEQISWLESSSHPINGYIRGWLWYYIIKRYYRDCGNEYVAIYYDRNTNTDTIIKSRCGLVEAKAACEQHNRTRHQKEITLKPDDV